MSRLNQEMLRETSYNQNELAQIVVVTVPLLPPDQKSVHHGLLEVYMVQQEVGGIIFLDAPGGTERHLMNLLLAKVRSHTKIALAISSS